MENMSESAERERLNNGRKKSSLTSRGIGTLYISLMSPSGPPTWGKL